MKFIGLFLVLLSVAWITTEYSRGQNRRLSELLGFIEFISKMRIGIGCFMKKGKELAEGVECKALEEVGFLGALSDGCSLSEAYEACRGRLSVGKREREILDGLFSSVGSGYLADGVRVVDKAEGELTKIADGLRGEVAKNIKLFGVLAAAGSVGVIILAV